VSTEPTLGRPEPAAGPAAGADGTAAAPDVTVVVLNYDSLDYTLRCLESIFAQSGRSPCRFHVVVVDNGSRSFDRPALERAFPQVEILQSERNRGFGGGCNLGAAGRASRFLFFLNNDTVFLNDVIGHLAAELDAHPRAGLCGAQQYDEARQPVRSTRPAPRLFSRGGSGRPDPRAESADRDHPVEVEGLSGADLFIRTDLFHEAGGFDERIFLYHEEDDLAARVQGRGRTLLLVPQARLLHYHARSSPARLSVQMEDALSLIYYFRKHGTRLEAALVRPVLLGRCLGRWIKHQARALAGRDPRGLAPVYRRLLPWALSGFPERTVAAGRQRRTDAAPATPAAPAATRGDRP